MQAPEPVDGVDAAADEPGTSVVQDTHIPDAALNDSTSVPEPTTLAPEYAPEPTGNDIITHAAEDRHEGSSQDPFAAAPDGGEDDFFKAAHAPPSNQSDPFAPGPFADPFAAQPDFDPFGGEAHDPFASSFANTLYSDPTDRMSYNRSNIYCALLLCEH